MSQHPKMPLPLRRAEATEAMLQKVNEIAAAYELPYHVLEDILYRLYVDAKDGSARECAAARTAHKSAVDAYVKASKTNEDKEETEHECTDQAGA